MRWSALHNDRPIVQKTHRQKGSACTGDRKADRTPADQDPGGERNAPLERTVLGGPLLATVTTLLFVPVVFAWLRRRGPASLRFPEDRALA